MPRCHVADLANVVRDAASHNLPWSSWMHKNTAAYDKPFEDVIMQAWTEKHSCEIHRLCIFAAFTYWLQLQDLPQQYECMPQQSFEYKSHELSLRRAVTWGAHLSRPPSISDEGFPFPQNIEAVKVFRNNKVVLSPLVCTRRPDQGTRPHLTQHKDDIPF